MYSSRQPKLSPQISERNYPSHKVLSALLYLQYHSVKNRLLVRLERLRQPKYLVGGIVGGIYFYFYFFRYLFRRQGSPAALVGATGSVDASLYEAIGACLLFGA